jgi:hypothetical protein
MERMTDRNEGRVTRAAQERWDIPESLLADLDPESSGEPELDAELSRQHISLCEILDRVLNKGVVLSGDVVISVANIDLVYLGLNVILCSAETAVQAGALASSESVSPEVMHRRRA